MLFLCVVVSVLFVYVCGGILAAVQCQDGIVIAADSLDTSGSYVTRRNSKKLFALTSSVAICCVSDPSADFHLLYDNIREKNKEYQDLCGVSMNIESIAKLSRKLIHIRYKDVHIVVAGCTGKVDSSPLFLCEILPKGSLIVSTRVISGTGSSIAGPLIEESLSNKDSTLEVAVPVLKRTITKVMNEDHNSGGKNPTIWLLHRLKR